MKQTSRQNPRTEPPIIKPKARVLSTLEATLLPVSVAVPVLHKSVLQQFMYTELCGAVTEVTRHESVQS